MASPAGVEHNEIVYPAAIPFALVHLGCFAAIWSGVSLRALAICIALYWLRIFAIGAGYHRYFSHKAYSTSRVFQFVLAFLAQSSAQNSVLWWAARHRHHHLHSDTGQDLHSPLRRGFFHSHVGWIFERRPSDTDLVKVEDLARYPELMWLHRFELAPAVILAVLCFALAGWSGLVVGFLWSTVLVYHSTFCINSLAHVRGSRRFVTGDDSRNNWLLAIFTMGEGWHNNHHAFQSSVRQGFMWWELDPTYYVLWLLSRVGLVWDLKHPPAAMLRGEHHPSGRAVERTAELLAFRFDPDKIASAIAATLHAPALSQLQTLLAEGLHGAEEVFASLHLPQVPKRTELDALAHAMFLRARSLEGVVDRAYALLLAAIGAQLVAYRVSASSLAPH